MRLTQVLFEENTFTSIHQNCEEQTGVCALSTLKIGRRGIALSRYRNGLKSPFLCININPSLLSRRLEVVGTRNKRARRSLSPTTSNLICPIYCRLQKPYPAWFPCQRKSYAVPFLKKIQGMFPTLCS